MMNVKNNMAVNFCGNSEILYNLGKALNKAQYMASGKFAPETSIDRSDVDASLASVRAYLDAATQDKSFNDFIDSYETHLTTPTNSRPGGSRRETTLPEIANLTNYFGEDKSLKIRALGFKIFENEFLHTIEEKCLYGEDSTMKKFRAFLNAISPSIRLKDIATTEQAKDFYNIMGKRMDYLS